MSKHTLILEGAAYVHRDDAKEQMVPLPVVGHWLKKAWGGYFKLSKRRQAPRIPGM
jgi:sulfide:quinone oxidoreductase